jgi:ribokinase
MSLLHVNSSPQAEQAPQLDILVFGSCFIDLVAYAERIPKPGETLTSTSYAKGFGGKGANQAVAASILGAKCGMAGLVGADGDGETYIKNLKDAGCDTSLMRQLPDSSTGCAFITVDAQGRNAIVICPNAAGRTGFTASTGSKAAHVPPHVFAAADFRRVVKPGGIFICQNEIPFEATLVALKTASLGGLYTIFNPAPAPSAAQVKKLKPFLQFITLVTPNEHEAALMTGVNDITDLAAAKKAIAVLRKMGSRDVIITMGSNGAAVQSRDMAEPVLIAPPRVKAIDSTGAGDCFCGSLAFFLSKGLPLVEAVKRANVCAAASVTRKGTQSSYHKPKELPQEIFAGFPGTVSKL